MAKSKTNDKGIDPKVIELDDSGKVIDDARVLEDRRADEIEAAFAAHAEKTGGFVSYAEVMRTGIPVSEMVARGWLNVPERSGLRKVKYGAATSGE